jgi:hypothetical protein
MTVIVVKDGVMGSDSRVTIDSEAGGSRMWRCQKLYSITELGVVIGAAGDGFAALRFVDWYRTKTRKKRKKSDADLLIGDADFSALVLHKSGKLEEFDKWCVGEEIQLTKGEFYAIGSGVKLALGALEMGADITRAIEIACKYDPYCAPPIVLASPGDPVV